GCMDKEGLEEIFHSAILFLLSLAGSIRLCALMKDFPPKVPNYFERVSGRNWGARASRVLCSAPLNTWPPGITRVSGTISANLNGIAPSSPGLRGTSYPRLLSEKISHLREDFPPTEPRTSN